MATLLMFLLGAVGMAHILVDGSIFNSFKQWLASPGLWAWSKGKLLEMMSCYQCSGFWSGLAIGIGMWCNAADPLQVGWTWATPFAWIVYAFAGSFASTKAAVIIVWVQSHSGASQ